LFIRIDASHLLRPEAVLAAVEIKKRTVILTGTFGNHFISDGGVSFLLRHGLLLGVEGIRPTIPVPDDIAVAIECHKSFGRRFDAKSRRQRQISASRASYHCHLVRIDAK